jgi:hypothetical protein
VFRCLLKWLSTCHLAVLDLWAVLEVRVVLEVLAGLMVLMVRTALMVLVVRVVPVGPFVPWDLLSSCGRGTHGCYVTSFHRFHYLHRRCYPQDYLHELVAGQKRLFGQ